MPISIEMAKKEGQPVEVIARKKIDTEKLIAMLKEQAYSAAELAEVFGASVNTIKTRIYKLRKEGYNVKASKVNGVTYYFIED